ncbi:hypothetical protein EV138_7022 [Kribbella voronezhensis]|uniref:Uncharacterized protein n=1 Tax=Kribbella voronezhensis TaxID=2512212 RepID=A0A4V3FJ18_9ACTN|nr:hypothetical protein [Kribbella voronezhensis]TDU84543.1 hypothetical protein EV138_7022 [Kribbella voronezhensis]
MFRRTLATAAAAAGIAALLPLTASAAGPDPVRPLHFDGKTSKSTVVAGTCNLSIPSRVAIGKPTLTLFGKVSGTCNTPTAASGWALHHPSLGDVNEVVFDKTYQYGDGSWYIPDNHPIGNMVFNGEGSYNADDTTNTQNTVPVTVKLAAGAWISSSRSADVVTLKGTSLLYSTTTNSYFKRSAGGVFQFRERGTTTWKNLKSVYTNSKGEVTMAYRYSKLRDYRFALYSTSISWDLGSAVTTR